MTVGCFRGSRLVSSWAWLAVIAMVAALTGATPAEARYRPGLTWRTIRNDHFTVYYPEGHEAAAYRILALSGEVHRDVTGYLGVEPRRTPIVLTTDTDAFNGFYAPFPNHLGLYETPDYEIKGFGSTTSDMMDLVFTHEYTHFAHITTREGWYGKLSRVFGDGIAVTNIVSPGWAIEGITTNLETRFTTGGRGRSPLFRSTVLEFARTDALWDLSGAGNGSSYFPPYGRIYHAGLFMVDYLNRTYGDDAFARISLDQARHPLSSTGRSLRRVTGDSPREFYRRFLLDVSAQADSLKRTTDAIGLPAGTTIQTALLDGIETHCWTPRNTILGYRSGYDRQPAIVEYNPSSGAIIDEQATGILPAFPPMHLMPDGALALSVITYHPLGDLDIDVADLAAFDPATRRLTRITRDAHIFSAAPSPDGSRFVAVRRNGMGNDLVLVNAGDGIVTPLVTTPGLYWERPCWSPDGRTIAVAVKSGAAVDIVTVNPVDGSFTPLFGSDQHGDGDPSFSPDGRWMVFASTRGGVWNIFAWDRTNAELRQLTSVFTSATEPLVSPDGSTLSFLVAGRTSSEIRTMPFSPASGRLIAVERGSAIPAPDMARLAPPVGTPAPRGIPLWEAYKPYIHSPWVDADEKGANYGVYLRGQDPIGLNAYSITAFYGPDSHRPGFNVSFTNRSLWPTINLNAYDKALDGNTLGGGADLWHRERGASVMLSQTIIHRLTPSAYVSSFALGGRVRRFDILEDGLHLPADMNTAASLLFETSLQHLTSSAPRDMTAGWNQILLFSREESIDGLGSEFPGYNQIVAFNQSIPSFIRHQGFDLTVTHQRQSGLLRYDNRTAIPLGYDDNDGTGGFDRSKVLTASLHYRFPIRFLDSGIGVTGVHFDYVRGSMFVEHGAGWDGEFDRDDWADAVQTSVGGTLTCHMGFILGVPLECGLAAGWKTREEEAFTRFIITSTPLTALGAKQFFTEGPLDGLRTHLAEPTNLFSRR